MGNQDGFCTDCGEPVWWQDERLVTRSGRRWCWGKDDSHVGMTHWHALPGMALAHVHAGDGEGIQPRGTCVLCEHEEQER